MSSTIPQETTSEAPTTATGSTDGATTRTPEQHVEGNQRIISETEEDTNHWLGIGALTFVAGGAGVILKQPALLLAAVVGVAYLAYVQVTTVPAATVRIRRELSDPTPDLGDDLAVTVTVTNEGDRVLPDLRVVDGVPEELTVVGGSARLGTALRPGESDSFSYTLTARRGTHEFKTCDTIVRDWSGKRERHTRFRTGGEVVVTPSLSSTLPMPLRKQTSQYAGRVETDLAGDGVEFHSTREYRAGDPLSRVDWRRYARTGDLATLQFREERAATVMLLLDLRQEAYVRRDEDDLHAADLGINAAGQIFTTLLETGDRVGITALAPQKVWLSPGLGNEHRVKVEELFAHHPALSAERPKGRYSVHLGVRNLRKHLSGDVQLVFFSPLCDDGAVTAAQLLHAHGHKVTVLSPDPTDDGTLGQRFARVERAGRISTLRQGGVRVLDWNPDEPLAESIARASVRWSR